MLQVGHIEQEMTTNKANTEVDNNEVTEENVYEGEVLDAKDQDIHNSSEKPVSLFNARISATRKTTKDEAN